MIQNMEICKESNPYFLIVPINEQGIDDVEYMREETPDILEYVLSPMEFQTLWNAHIFENINTKYHLLIDTYETETIPLECCAGSLSIVREAGLEKDSVFATALKQAMNYGTFVECGF